MSDGITDGWKKMEKEDEIKMETRRVEMLEKELEKAKRNLRELKRDK
jgi:predicted RNase H-like nuclease (RuvC/YqgF family)